MCVCVRVQLREAQAGVLESFTPVAPAAPAAPVTVTGFDAPSSSVPLSTVHINTLTVKRKTPAPSAPVACGPETTTIPDETQGEAKRVREE